MAELKNGQTCLEVRGMDERHRETVRSDYNIDDQYSATHPDALSDGDPLGKGTGHGGHTAYLPDCSKPTNLYNYSNFDTVNGGGEYDVYGRNGSGGRLKAMASSLYNQDYQYGADLVNTQANVDDGQVRLNW